MTHKLDEMSAVLRDKIFDIYADNVKPKIQDIVVEALTQAYNQAIEDAKNAIKSKQIQLHEQTRSYVVDVLDQLKKETK